MIIPYCIYIYGNHGGLDPCPYKMRPKVRGETNRGKTHSVRPFIGGVITPMTLVMVGDDGRSVHETSLQKLCWKVIGMGSLGFLRELLLREHLGA